MEGKRWPFVLMIVAGVYGLLAGAWLLVLGWFGSWMSEDDYSGATIWGAIIGVVALGLLIGGVNGVRRWRRERAAVQETRQPEPTPMPDSEGPQRPAPAEFAPCPSCDETINTSLGRCPYCGADLSG